MKTTQLIEKELDIKFVKAVMAVRYEDEDIPYDFPFRENDTLTLIIDVETGAIQNWPLGVAADVYMKVCDEGSYFLIDDKGEVVASMVNDYVPNRLIPGKYGDYVDLKINEEGIITNWSVNIRSFNEFFPYRE